MNLFDFVFDSSLRVPAFAPRQTASCRGLRLPSASSATTLEQVPQKSSILLLTLTACFWFLTTTKSQVFTKLACSEKLECPQVVHWKAAFHL